MSNIQKHIRVQDLDNPSVAWSIGVPLRMSSQDTEYKTIHVTALYRDDYGTAKTVIDMPLEEFKTIINEVISVADRVQAKSNE